MKPTGKQDDDPSVLSGLLKSDHPAASFARDLLWVIGVVGAIALVLFLVSGTWPAVVAVESESMVPNMKVGDLVFVVEENRFGDLLTHEEGMRTGSGRFNAYPARDGNPVYGDVIIYRPNGVDSVHPIIHRAMALTDRSGEGGYITRGDNNPVVDQNTILPGVGVIEPVREEWIVGKALFAVPLVGYLPLNIVPVAVAVLVIMILHEAWLRMRETPQDLLAGKKKKKPKS
ncbi:MAG: S26 family signal peptidase [Methanomicrobiaceae archaeon]|nr:S26 family signal peptidase [Methanomicrobiaceae archaeon]